MDGGTQRMLQMDVNDSEHWNHKRSILNSNAIIDNPIGGNQDTSIEIEMDRTRVPTTTE
jgi:hypothetical protein